MPVESVESPEDSHVHLGADEELSSLMERHGYLVLRPAEDSFQRIVLSILRQQVSMASADAMRERLFSKFEVDPENILAANTSELQNVGLSEAKSEYIRNVAEAFQENGWSREYFDQMADGEVVDELTEVRGVGPWTAKMYLQFGLGRQDVFPVEDLGIRQAMEAMYGLSSVGEMQSHAEEWAPYRSIASLYLWRFTEE
ncbi:MAG: DNA-3-methyladenine glycosylase [Halanaeroarchaeum sp.]